MPSTTSSSVSSDFASSTVITPSLPTFFIASAMKRPISTSPLAEMVPPWAISSLEVPALEFFCRSATTASTARSTPRLRSIGFMPAATALAPSRTMACASTVAVGVPSPASSEGFQATSRTICAPMFSNLSSSSISLATVTPSLVIRGAPKLLSSTTLRPFGPSVTRTAWARVSMPRSILSRASTANLISLADILVISVGGPRPSRRALARPPQDEAEPWSSDCFLRVSKDEVAWSRRLLLRTGAIDHAHDVAFLHDQQVFAVKLDLGARPLAEQHAVADLEIDGDELAGLVAAARAHRGDLALRRLLLGGIGDDDAAGRLGPRIGGV